MNKIIYNRAKCLLCGDIVESLYEHHAASCTCGNVVVKGGQVRLERFVFDMKSIEEMSKSCTNENCSDCLRNCYHKNQQNP